MSNTGDKKLFIKTWGCQMNVYDSQKMADVLSPLGYKTTDTPDDADLMILNTCHIREKATEKVFSDLGRLRPIKEKREEEGNKTLIAVAGCVAQAEGDVIIDRAKYVDMVFGPQIYHKLPEMILEASGQKRTVNTEFPVESKFDNLPEETLPQGPAAFLSIQEGCDKFCTFCVVPYTRGAEYSRNVEQILDEAKRLVDQGTKDINLLGQNVNAFHGTDNKGNTWDLAQLIAAVADINGVERIKYTTSHPRDMTEELIQAHSIEKLMPFLHLPVQSGSNNILELMNRKHTAESYLDIIERLRKVRPDLAFSSDFIVGFPGEKDEDHEATLELVKKVNYAACYSFKYSPRPGTPGASMGGIVPEKVKSERLTSLQEILFKQQKDFNDATIGKTVPVLFDRKGQKEGQLLGKTPWMQSVYVQANERLFGEIVDVKIDESFTNGLSGSIVTNETVSPSSDKKDAA